MARKQKLYRTTKYTERTFAFVCSKAAGTISGKAHYTAEVLTVLSDGREVPFTSYGFVPGTGEIDFPAMLHGMILNERLRRKELVWA